MTLVSTSVQCGDAIGYHYYHCRCSCCFWCHGIVIVYLAVISVVDGVVFGSDSAVVPTIVATVVAVMDGIFLNVSCKQHAIVERQTVRHLPAPPEDFDTPNIDNSGWQQMGRYSPKDANDLLLCATIRVYEVLPPLCKPWQHYVDFQHCKISQNESLDCQTITPPE